MHLDIDGRLRLPGPVGYGARKFVRLQCWCKAEESALPGGQG